MLKKISLEISKPKVPSMAFGIAYEIYQVFQYLACFPNAALDTSVSDRAYLPAHVIRDRLKTSGRRYLDELAAAAEISVTITDMPAECLLRIILTGEGCVKDDLIRIDSFGEVTISHPQGN